MDPTYLLTPFLAWLLAGTIKFLINSARAGKPAFGLIGYGGLPSNHTAIASSVAFLIAYREGFDAPAFGVAVAVTFIVVLDAASLRRQVGLHAEALNKLLAEKPGFYAGTLRERMGHTAIEIVAGLATGAVVAMFADRIF